MKLFVFDLETTGVKYWKNGIHQIAGMIVIDGRKERKFNFKVRPNPLAEIDDEALMVGKVTKEEINAYPPMEKIFAGLKEILSVYVNPYDKKDKFFLVGYNNTAFDNQFLRAWFAQNDDPYFGSWFWSNSIDVMVLASFYLMGVRPSMENFKLKTVAKQMGIEVDESRLHDAQYDIELTYSIFKFL